MINKIEIENFKCFSTRTEIQLSPITVCTGMNSVGKSSLIQALLLMWQSYENLSKNNDKNEAIKVLLNTSALKLGSTSQIMQTNTSMQLSADGSSFKYHARSDKLSLNLENRNSLGDCSSFQSILYYLNAERLGPRNYQEMLSHDTLHCGYHGEYTFDIIQKKLYDRISKNRCHVSDARESINDLRNQVNDWMSYIVNGVEVDFTAQVTTQLARMKIRQAVLDTPFNSPYNYGFGISYVLPIIATGLIAEDNSIFIIENPEAHLHPAGQSRIGEFLAQMSCDSIQLIIETHSEHVLNGIRKYALRHQLDPESICINYFAIDYNAQTHEARHEVKRLLLGKKMDILHWPAGFFDQEASDLKELRMLRGNFQ